MAFRSAGNASRSFVQASGASHTPLLHSSSSIYDNDDETEAELAAMMRDDEPEEQGVAHQVEDHGGADAGIQSSRWGSGEFVGSGHFCWVTTLTLRARCRTRRVRVHRPAFSLADRPVALVPRSFLEWTGT